MNYDEDIAPIIDRLDQPIVHLNEGAEEHVVAVKSGYTLRRVGMKPQRSHVFDDIRTFAAFVKDRCGDNARAADILVGESQIQAALTPEFPFGDLVSCTLPPHPWWKEWVEILRKPIDQRSLFEFILGHRETLPEAFDVLYTELRKLSATCVAEMQVELDERGFTTFAGKTTKTVVQGAIPGAIRVRAPVYCDVVRGDKQAVYELELAVRMRVSAEGVSFLLMPLNLDLVLMEARKDAAAYLTELLGEPFLVGLGTAKLVLNDLVSDPTRNGR